MRSLSLIPATPENFEDFKDLRKMVMREHVDRQKLPWIEAEEDAYHAALFAREGLQRIICDGAHVGYVGLNEVGDDVEINRFVMRPAFQRKGIGTAVFTMIFEKEIYKGKKFVLDVLHENYAQNLFKRMGFVPVGRDEKFVAYERRQDAPPYDSSSP